MCKIIIIEDHPEHGPSLKKKLEALGHEAHLFVGVNVITDEGELYVLPPENAQDGVLKNINYNRRTKGCVLINACDYDIALVDGAIMGIIRDGFAVVPAFAERGIVCVGISNGHGSNQEMEAAGAKFYVDKIEALENLELVIANASNWKNKEKE
jgi:hypothetical protein